MCCLRQCRYSRRIISPVESPSSKCIPRTKIILIIKLPRCVHTVCALCSTVDDEPRPAPSNPVLAIAMVVAGSCSSFLARLNGANKPTGRTAEGGRPIDSRREGSLPRQNWVSVNSAGAFPASQYFLPAWHPGRLHQCLQPLLLLPGSPAPQTLAVRLRLRHTVFLSLPY